MAKLLRTVFAVVILVSRCAHLVEAQDGDKPPEHKKEYAEDYQRTLKGDVKDNPGLEIFGPDATGCVRFEPEGLRITLPLNYPSQRSGTGVVTEFGIKGDFEITLGFEILKEPSAGLGGNPTDLRLIVVPQERPEPEVWFKSTQNRASLGREAAGRGNVGGFVADPTKWNPILPKDKWGNEIFNNIESHPNYKRVLAKAKSGKLRLVRTGAELFYYMSDGANEDFALLQKSDFGAKDLRNVRVLASTGEPLAAFDVRVSDLRIRADAFAKEAPLAILPAPPAPPRGQWLIALLIGGGVAVTLPFILAAALILRSRRHSAAAQSAKSERSSTPVVLECAHCGKKLKTRSNRAGKIKCPQCNKTVDVPADASEESK